jgi:hypothetical protein
MTDSVAALPQAKPKKMGDGTIGYFLYRQGFAVPFAIGLLIFFFFFNPHTGTFVGTALWNVIPFLLIFIGYLAITQFLPVIKAPIFESHFATLKDIGVSVWPPIAFGVACLLALTLGELDILWWTVDVDLTWIELGIGLQILVAFGLDILMGTVFTSLKNRLASEQGMGRMPGAS